MHTTKEYQSAVVRTLREEARYMPREAKLEQAARAESLIDSIEPASTYSYEYLSFRIRNYRPDEPGDKAQGEAVKHDLRLLVEDLTDAADVHAEEANEPVLTLEEVSKLFNVSTKTISRWRQQGLISRRFIVDGRKRVGFLHSSVEQFARRNRERVKRGERFSQLTDTEKNEIIDRARRFAAAGGAPSDITKRIAKHMGRSTETIRYTLRKFDLEHPEMAVFPDQSGPLSEEAKQKIYQRRRRGESPDSLAKRYGRTKSSIHRIVNEMRAKRILELPLDWIHNEAFDNPALDAELLAPTPVSLDKPRKPRVPSGLPPYLIALYETPLLESAQEQHLFRKFNYLKYKAAKLRENLEPARASATRMDEIERLYDEAVQTKNEIVQANLRLVVSIAKRHVTPNEDFFQLVSDGNMSLIRAVEKFDYARGNKFSTYASWAIMKNFARTIPDEYKHRDRFRTSSDETFQTRQDERGDVYSQEAAQQLREDQVGRILSRLDEREQQIIISRFGLNHKIESMTLKEVGAELGVTKERIRQIEARALNKLRQVVQEEKIELPDEE